jgi:hypothetical protein
MHMETAEILPVAEASTAARMTLIATSTTAITSYCSLCAGWACTVMPWLGTGVQSLGPSYRAGVCQQPPVHQFRMRPFKPLWGWTKNTSSSLEQGFFSPLLCSKFFPSYLPPPLLSHFSLTPSGEFRRAFDLE